MDAQRIRHGVSDGNRQNTAGHDRTRVRARVQSHHQAKRSDDPRCQSETDPRFPRSLHAATLLLSARVGYRARTKDVANSLIPRQTSLLPSITISLAIGVPGYDNASPER
jgi:hypothetical protein